MKGQCGDKIKDLKTEPFPYLILNLITGKYGSFVSKSNVYLSISQVTQFKHSVFYIIPQINNIHYLNCFRQS